MTRLLITTAMLALIGTGAQAQDAERYQLQKTDNGYVRLDTRTGAMSICEERETQLICRMAADESVARDDDTSRLRDRLRLLEARVAALEGKGGAVPSEQEFDQSLDRMESFFKRFMGVVKEFEREDTTPAPNRT
jgi:hypothetical protein